MATTKGPKVTIYSKGPAGNIIRTEGLLTAIHNSAGWANVAFIPKGARREAMIMSYYSPFWMVVEGWGHPEPQGLYDPATERGSGEVTSMRGRYRSQDPRWEKDFYNSLFDKLKSKIIAVHKEGKTKIVKPNLVPETKVQESSMVDKLGNLLEALGGSAGSQVAKQLHAQLQSFQDMLRSHSQDLAKAAGYMKQLEPALRAAISKGNGKVIEDAAELMSDVNKELNECHLPLAEAVDKLHKAVAVELPDWKRG